MIRLAVRVLGLLAGVHAEACSTLNPCPSGQFCNMNDVTSGSCESCNTDCGSNCYSCGLNTIEGQNNCAANCSQYTPRCEARCGEDHCGAFPCPPAQCGGCPLNTYCNPSNPIRADWHSRCPAGWHDEGSPIGTILASLPLLIPFLCIVYARRARLNRIRKAQQQQQQQQGMQLAQADMPLPTQQQVAMPMSGGLVPMQIVLPPGAVPGQSIQVNVNGQIMSVVVPPGAQPGSQITIQVPAPQQDVPAMPTAAAVPMQQATAVPVMQTVQGVPIAQAQPVGAQGGHIIMGFTCE